jgi:hypothetical protein
MKRLAMNQLLPRALALLTLAVCVLLSNTAGACDGFGPWTAYGYYYRQPLRTGNLPTPPYFAIHPPVYYGGLMRRPYGDSPFAYYPDRPMLPAPLGGTRQIVIENHHLQPLPENTTQTTASRAKLIVNPYYESSQLASSR